MLKSIAPKSPLGIAEGTEVSLRWLGESDPRGHSFVELTPIGGRPIMLKIIHLPAYVSGFKLPSESSLERWASEGIGKTPTGKLTEPDGFGSDGSPSWLLALGFV